MSNKNLHFKGQMENEEIVTFFRRHWIVLLPHAIPFLLYLAVIGVFLSNLPKFQLPSIDQFFFQLLVILVTVATAYMIHRFFLKMIDHYLNVVIITNQRVVEIKKSLFVHDGKESVDMRKVQDIQKQQNGLIKNFIRCGELFITLGTSEPKVLSNVPNPDYHFRLLNRLKGEIISKISQEQRPHQSVYLTTDAVNAEPVREKPETVL